MSWTVVKGKYTGGVIQLSEEVPEQEDIEVLILFPQRSPAESAGNAWQRIKKQIASEMPDLLQMSEEEREREFANLSETIARRMPYRSLAEFERAMRRDEYDLARY